jgi:hypothetical protein
MPIIADFGQKRLYLKRRLRRRHDLVAARRAQALGGEAVVHHLLARDVDGPELLVELQRAAE